MKSKILLLTLALLNSSILLSSCSVKSKETISSVIKQQESDLVVGVISAATQKAESKLVESKLIPLQMNSSLPQESVPKCWESQVKNGSRIIYITHHVKGAGLQRCLATTNKSGNQLKIESCISSN